jgi:hypothetical protein
MTNGMMHFGSRFLVVSVARRSASSTVSQAADPMVNEGKDDMERDGEGELKSRQDKRRHISPTGSIGRDR